MTTTATTAICSATSPDPSDSLSLSDCFLPQSESPSHACTFLCEGGRGSRLFQHQHITRGGCGGDVGTESEANPRMQQSLVRCPLSSLSFSLSAVAQFIDFLPSPATPTWRGTRASV